MKKQGLKWISVLLAAVMLLGTLPAVPRLTANAATIVDSGVCGAEGDGSNLKWTLDSDGALVIRGSGKMRNYHGDCDDYGYYSTSPWCRSVSRAMRIKTVSIQYGVTSIGESAFCYCTELATVTFPKSLTSIGNSAFGKCEGLTSVTLPDGLTEIGSSAFCGCKRLTSVTLPESLIKIGKSAFSGCKRLTSVTLPDGLTTIGSWVFSDCTGLTSVILPNSLTEIGDSAFSGCTGLTSVTFPNSLTEIGDSAFYKCTGLTSVTLPDGLTEIGDSVFYNCSGLTSVTFPDGLTTIKSGAFYNCYSLTSVTFPNSLTEIGDSAFYKCTRLTSVTFPDGLTKIGNGAFYGCKRLTSVTFPDGLTTIGYDAFNKCGGLTSVTFPDSLTTIGSYAFFGCKRLTSVSIPVSVTYIGSYAFYNCSGLKNVYYGGSQADWNKINICSNNNNLKGAIRCYNHLLNPKISKVPAAGDMGEITYSCVNCGSSITVPLVSVSFNVSNAKTDYIHHDAPDLSGVKLIAKDENGKTNTLDVTTDMVQSGGDTEVLGAQTITLACGIVTGSYQINVYPLAVSEIALDKTELTLDVGGKQTLTATLSPANATDGTVVWASDDEMVAMVDANGTVTAKRKGVAFITATAHNGISAVCMVTVVSVPAGDVDGSGDITAADARLCLRRAVGLENYAETSREYIACNVDGDNDVTASDARLILRAAVGLEKLAA